VVTSGYGNYTATTRELHGNYTGTTRELGKRIKDAPGRQGRHGALGGVEPGLFAAEDVEGFFVFGLLGDFADEVDVLNIAFAVEDDDGAGEQSGERAVDHL